MPVPGKAHAKFIVLGEHSILHGGQALIYPIKELELTLSTKPSLEGPQLNGKSLDGEQRSKLQEVLSALQLEVDLRSLQIDSDIPLGKGLGSSAALCVAFLRAYRPQLSMKETARWAMQGENVFHGRSSGADPHAIALEQAIAYRMENSEYRALNLAPDTGHAFLLRDSGAEHATDTVIEKVSSLKLAQPRQFESILDRLKVNTTLGLRLIEENDFTRLGLVLQDSNRLLADLGLSNSATENAIESLLSEGALGAKITGAGLGGYVFGLFPDHQLPRDLRPGDFIVPCSGL